MSQSPIFQKLSQIEQRIGKHNNLTQMEQQVINEINRNNLRLDQIIDAVKKIVKSSDSKGAKRNINNVNHHVNNVNHGNHGGNFNSTPDKVQPKKLKDRVEKLLGQNQGPKYIK